jgi:predicted regulator of Ras-like GTPase activity (Roadblock/LC7/MglB family)
VKQERIATLERYALDVVAPGLVQDVMTHESRIDDLVAAVLSFVFLMCDEALGRKTTLDLFEAYTDGIEPFVWTYRNDELVSALIRRLAGWSSTALDELEPHHGELFYVMVAGLTALLTPLNGREYVLAVIAGYADAIGSGRLTLTERKLS